MSNARIRMLEQDNVRRHRELDGLQNQLDNLRQRMAVQRHAIGQNEREIERLRGDGDVVRFARAGT